MSWKGLRERKEPSPPYKDPNPDKAKVIFALKSDKKIVKLTKIGESIKKKIKAKRLNEKLFNSKLTEKQKKAAIKNIEDFFWHTDSFSKEEISYLMNNQLSWKGLNNSRMVERYRKVLIDPDNARDQDIKKGIENELRLFPSGPYSNLIRKLAIETFSLNDVNAYEDRYKNSMLPEPSFMSVKIGGVANTLGEKKLKSILNLMQKETENKLKTKNIKSVVLYRGLSHHTAFKTKLSSLNSFSPNKEEALTYTSTNNLIKKDIPINKILTIFDSSANAQIKKGLKNIKPTEEYIVIGNYNNF
ncbi:hypothetical protein M0R19_04530 [Candidatus Pacearchaeota archaeon]|jgi:hypothetical protein|nr:hypothetical protein [Candidatus Pacearchaeota archaeon]